MDKRFEDLLLQYARAGTDSQRKGIQEQLWKEFGSERAIFVMDMSGFSLLTQRYGIVHYLSMVKRMQLATQPVIERFGGTLVKFEADNCFAMFDAVGPAVRAATELNHLFNSMNESTGDEFDLRVSIGIDFGRVLLIGGPDFFGDAVNLACKLGEDAARPGEILVTEAAFKQGLAQAGIEGELLELSMAGVRLNAVRVKYP